MDRDSDFNDRNLPDSDGTQGMDEGDEVLEDFGQHWTTLGELGKTLPLAIGPDRSFEFHPSTLGLRQRITALTRERRNKDTQAEMICFAIALALKRLQGRDLTSLKLDEAALVIRQLPWTSVLYLLVCWTVEQAGGEDSLPLGNVRCPACGTLHRKATGRAGEMTVRAYGELSDLPRIAVGLEDGFPVAGKVAMEVVLQPGRWSFLCSLPDGELQNQASVTVAGLQSAICSVDVVEGAFSPPAVSLLGLSTRDALSLDAEHSLLSGGPTMAVPVACGGHEFFVSFDWKLQDFLGSPDRKARRSRRRSLAR